MITLTYGGEFISEDAITSLRSKLPKYDLATTKLDILQGFAYLNDTKDSNDIKAVDPTKKLTSLLNEKETEIRDLKAQVDAITAQSTLGQRVFAELKVQYPQIDSCIIDQDTNHSENKPAKVWVAVIRSKQKLADLDRIKIEDWLKVRVSAEHLQAYFDEDPVEPNKPSQKGPTQ